MLAHSRLRLIFVVAVLVLAILPSLVRAQIHGVAPSVTSFGFGGSSNPTPGVPASVTSLGPNGFACCSAPFISPFFVPLQQARIDGPRFDGRRLDGNRSDRARSGGRRFHDHLRFPVGVIVPAYVPYAVPYSVADEEDVDDSAADATSDDSTRDYSNPDYSRQRRLTYDYRSPYRGTSSREASAIRAAKTDSGLDHERPSAKENAAAADSDSLTPVAAQPLTVLIFRDGRKVELQNYAIVGETLFDFSGNLSHKIQMADLDLPGTQKANEDRGVEFQVPAQKGQ